MRQQPGQEMPAGVGEQLALPRRHEGVGAALAVGERLVQVPARRHHVGDARPAHEGRVQAVAPADLLHGAAEQHHGVGRLQPAQRLEGELALARAVLALHRPQRQAERDDVAADDLEHGLDLVEAQLGEILIAVGEDADPRRRAGLARLLRRHAIRVQLEDVELDLEAGNVVVARPGEPRERRGRCAAWRRARADRRGDRRRPAASRSCAPRAGRGRSTGRAPSARRRRLRTPRGQSRRQPSTPGTPSCWRCPWRTASW